MATVPSTHSTSTSGPPKERRTGARVRPGIPTFIPDHEMLRPVGKGSCGEVWLARNLLAEYRAVKVVWLDEFGGESRTFEREFQGVKRFEPISRSHPSQLAILHVGLNPEMGCFFCVMELADDVSQSGQLAPGSTHTLPRALNPPTYQPRTLRAELRGRGALPAGEVVALGLALAAALGHLHGHGLIHRDIKPSNIVFIHGRPKLADIGLVTDAHPGDDSRSIVGTEGYLAPEGGASFRADIFALGKVLYEAVTGLDRNAFPQLPPDLRTRPDARELIELNEILLKACARDPRDRYASVGELQADLQFLAAGKSVKRRAAVGRSIRWSVGVVLVLALGAGAVVPSGRIGPRPVVVNALEHLGTTNVLARDHYLQGMFLVEKSMDIRARLSFERAVAEDPSFARAHARYGESLMHWDQVRDKGTVRAFGDAEAVLLQALKLDARCGEAWAALGKLRLTHGARFAEAERLLRRAIGLVPPEDAPWGLLSACLAYQGKTTEAVLIARRGLEANPLRLLARMTLGRRLLEARRFRESADAFRETLHLFPEVAEVHMELGGALELAGEKDLAAAAYLEWCRVLGDSQEQRAALQAAYAKEGLRAFWRPSYEDIIQGRRARFRFATMGGVEVFAAMGDETRALDAIDEVLRHRWNLGWLRVNPHLDPLRNHPRFVEQLKRLDAIANGE